MLAWTWGTWPNVLVDFGRELYVPWRLAEGEVLYRDIAYFNGPLSPYLNALWFRLFGVGLRTLVACNGLLLVGLVAMLYALLTRVSDRVGATAACLLFATVFAFSQIDAIGNDNYLTPYSHEATHGLLLSLAALLGFTRYRVRPLASAATCGFALGLVWLTKAEIFAATGAALAVAFALTWWSERGGRGRALASLGVLVAAALCPPLLALALLGLAMPTGDALTGILGSWPSVFEPQLTGQYFYRATLGTLDVEANLRELLEWSAGYTAFALALVALGRGLGGTPAEGSSPGAEGSSPGAEGSFPGAEGSSPGAEGSSPGAEGSFPGAEGSSPNTRPGLLRAEVSRPFPLLCWAGSFGLLSLLDVAWPEALRPLPLVMLLLLVLCGASFARETSKAARDEIAVLRVALLVFALVLLAKVILRVRLDQYGFALAMPATLLLTVALVSWLPAAAGGTARGGRIIRAGALGAISAVALSLVWVIQMRVDERTHPVGADPDRFLAGFRAPAVNAALADIEERLGSEDSLAVLPEGVMLNYLARRPNSTGHINFMPPELIIFGESRILDALRANPPDYVALTHKDTREYGLDFFGRGYGRALLAWVKHNYQPVALFGQPPLRQGTRFGIRLMKRNGTGEPGEK
jgi:hypothetical protein